MSLTDEDKQWIIAQLEQERQWMVAQLEQERHWMVAQLERVETALLTEFHKWASPMEMRVRSHSAVLHALDLEVAALSERVTKLEGSGGNQAR